jgi:hypothetical protein
MADNRVSRDSIFGFSSEWNLALGSGKGRLPEKKPHFI